MTTPQFPAARISGLIQFLTILTYAILAVVVVVGLRLHNEPLWLWYGATIGLPVALGVLGPLFMVRGYSIEGNRLLVHRVGWSSQIPLSDDATAEVDPEALKGAIRLVGNGGLYCFAGVFRSKKLGMFRPFVTDPARAVIVRGGGKTWVLSPADPESFAAALANRDTV